MIDAAAAAWGRTIGRYGRRVVDRGDVRFLSEPVLPDAPTIWVCWHEFNLVAIAVYARLRKRHGFAFVPRGPVGATVAAWIAGSGLAPMPVDGGARDGLVLRRMRDAMAGGGDIVIAVDGPAGPRRRLRPGALWLAMAAGAPVIAFASAATPAIRIPRWDRHLVPLPGARIAVAMSAPMTIERGDIEEEGRRLAAALDQEARRAAAAIASSADGMPREDFRPRSAGR